MRKDNLDVNKTNENYVNITGRRIKALRNYKRITQDQLGNEIGLKKATISRIENGSAMPSRAALERIAIFFNVSVDYLLGNVDTYNIVDDATLKRYKKLLNFLISKPKDDQELIVELLEKLLKK